MVIDPKALVKEVEEARHGANMFHLLQPRLFAYFQSFA